MTGWLVWGVLMLVCFSKASVLSDKLNHTIKEGIEKINAIEELLEKEVEGVNREINKISLYFSRAVNESMFEGQTIYITSVQKVEKIIIKNFEEGIDKDIEIRILLYLLETMETTKDELYSDYDTFKSSLKTVLAKKSNELQKLKILFEFTEMFSTGFYEGVRANVKNCKDEECVKILVEAAENKKKILTNIYHKYVQEISSLSVGLKNGHRLCVLDAQKKFSNLLKKFDTDIEYIPRTQDTEDLTDRFDPVNHEW